MLALHNFECEICGVFEEYTSDIKEAKSCPKCGLQSKVTWDWGKCNNVNVFQPYWEDNIDFQPVYIESREQLARELDKRDLKAARLMDGYKDYHIKRRRV